MIDFLKRQRVSAANCALTIFAHHIIERLGHEGFQTEALLAGAKVHGKRLRLVIDDNHVIRGTTVYLTGPFMHPGGGVFGAGRATAIQMMDDMGLDYDKVCGRAV